MPSKNSETRRKPSPESQTGAKRRPARDDRKERPSRAPRGTHEAGLRHKPRPLRVEGVKAYGTPVGLPLFRPLAAEMHSFLETLPALLDEIVPLNSAHRRDLPDAVSELSALLTTERSGLSLPYWSSPRLTSAYLRYFLPWNLIRLGRFLPGLDLPSPRAGALLADLGSGPLTMPLALWLTKPEWREIPLEILAVDASSQPLEFGRKLFALAAPQSPWRIRNVRAPLHKALREVRGTPWMITAGNVLNEFAERKERRGDRTQAERLAELAFQMAAKLTDDGVILCVEPGTRLGGTVLEQLRAGAQEAGLAPCSPCPHDGECPLLERRGVGSGWCHAVMDTAEVPSWLHQLAQDARLSKISLSLAHLMLRPRACMPECAPGAPDPARVLSDAFAVPGLGLSRYVCTAKGLALLAAASAAPQGALVSVRPSRPPRRDPKSGVPVMVVSD